MAIKFQVLGDLEKAVSNQPVPCFDVIKGEPDSISLSPKAIRERR